MARAAGTSQGRKEKEGKGPADTAAASAVAAAVLSATRWACVEGGCRGFRGCGTSVASVRVTRARGATLIGLPLPGNRNNNRITSLEAQRHPSLSMSGGCGTRG